MRLTTLLLLVLLALGNHATANRWLKEKVYYIDDQKDIITELEDYFYLAEDNAGEYSFAKILKLDSLHSLFKPYASFQQPLNPASVYWGKLILRNASNRTSDYIFIIAPDGTNYVEVYAREVDGNFVLKKTGEYQRFEQKEIPQGRQCKVKLRIRPGEEKVIYIRLQNPDNRLPAFDLRLEKPDLFWAEIEARNFTQGVFLGVILIMFMYNLMLFGVTKDRSYLGYALLLLSVGFYFVHYYGFLLEYVAHNFPVANSYLFVLSGASVIFYFYFVRHFAETGKNAPELDRLLNLLIKARGLMLFGEVLLLAITFNFALVQKISTFTLLAALVLGSLLLVKLLPRKRDFVLFLMAGTFALVFSAIIAFSLRYYLHINYAAAIIQFGILSMIMLFSLGLGYRFKKHDQQRITEQQQLIDQLRDSEQKRIDLNHELERKVEERTKKVQEHQQEIAMQAKELVEMNWELYEKNDKLYSINNQLEKANETLKAKNTQLNDLNEKLNNTLAQLKAAQVQLIQSEKMASVGLLTAGIAHEINNPVNFVSAGAETLESLLKDVMEVVAQYSKITSGNSSEEIKAFLQDMDRMRSEMDFDDNCQDIFSLVVDIKTGARRTSEIVKGLRNFSRLDEDELKRASIHEGLDSTLTLLRNHLKDGIEVVKNYDPLHKSIECYPGQLNQVFMNVLVNAVHAIKHKGGSEKGRIEIKTSVKLPEAVPAGEGEGANRQVADAMLEISVSDNGTGMPEGVRKRIFEPFYTTKQVGEGTGLGLSISHGIIERHGGKIEVRSRPGAGTVFIISIPALQQKG